MLFPELVKQPAAKVNLDEVAIAWAQRHEIPTYGNNPLLDPDIAATMLTELHRDLGVSWSWGGYLEDRSTLLRGSYLDAGRKYVHLGVDFNVPEGTKVALDDYDAWVLHIDDDYPDEYGWGTRVLLCPENDPEAVLVYAHLDRNLMCEVGNTLKAGTVFARVGVAPYNGGWAPHLHMQGVKYGYFKALQRENRLAELDGYCSSADVERMKRFHFDPHRYVPHLGV